MLENESTTPAEPPAQVQQPTVGPVRTISDKIMDVVKHHAPDAEQIDSITSIRGAAANFIAIIIENCPRNPDRSAAIRKVREAMMTANASIVVPDIQL